MNYGRRASDRSVRHALWLQITLCVLLWIASVLLMAVQVAILEKVAAEADKMSRERRALSVMWGEFMAEIQEARTRRTLDNP